MKRSTTMRAVLAAALSLSLAACGGLQIDQAKSNLSRDLAPAVPDADAKALAEGNAAFAADLFKQVRGSGNAMVSPYSVSLALAMTWAGAKGETEAAMAKALRFGLPQDQLHPAFDKLDLALASRGQGAQGKDGKPFRLTIANAAWGQKDFAFVPAYLDRLAVSYGAGVNLLDFALAPEDARRTINDWVADKTEDRSKDLRSEGSIDGATRLVLTNAVYFNAAWAQKFEPSATSDAGFKLGDGTAVSVPTMHGTVGGAMGEGADFTAAELPYSGGDTSMVVVLPKTGSLDDFVASLDGAKLAAIGASLKPSEMQVSLPKFKFEFKQGLAQALTALGMGVAFTGDAAFSGIHADGGLLITDVIHQTFVAVDEDGTEAAAATAVVLGKTSVAANQFTVDRPFLFLIRDVQTGTAIFLGQVADPR